MPKAPVILIYGKDPSLLETRRWVLERAHCQVLTTLNLEEAQNHIASQHIDLFILCHSLGQREQERALATAHRIRPNLKNLIMNPELADITRFHGDTQLTTFVDPRTLIDTAIRLIDLTGNTSSEPGGF